MFARQLRRNQTDVEKTMWMALRNRQINDLKFRRQVAIGKYIVDFVCFQNKLIIELDGGQHADAVEYDNERTRWLESQGFTVLRYWNNDVLANMEGVLMQIVELSAKPPHLQCAYSLAGEYRQTGGWHAIRNPCFTPTLSRQGRGLDTE